MIPIPEYKLNSLRRLADKALSDREDAKVIIQAADLIDLLDMAEYEPERAYEDELYNDNQPDLMW